MRLFVAVDVGAAVVTAAMALVAELQRRVRVQAPRARVTWTTAGRLHLTLAFVGSVDVGRAAAVREVLREPFGSASFELSVAGVGAFPGRGAPRVLWVGVEAGRAAVVELAGAVADRLAALGIPGDARPFHPHLTLGRVREAAGLRTAVLFEGLPDVPLGTTQVEAITLFESQLSPGGPAYAALQHTRLGSGESGRERLRP